MGYFLRMDLNQEVEKKHIKHEKKLLKQFEEILCRIWISFFMQSLEIIDIVRANLLVSSLASSVTVQIFSVLFSLARIEPYMQTSELQSK